jgi:hypothetical protein
MVFEQTLRRAGAARFAFRWRPDFDMTQPGHYQIRLGGKMNYLDTTICSNTLDVTIE